MLTKLITTQEMCDRAGIKLTAFYALSRIRKSKKVPLLKPITLDRDPGSKNYYTETQLEMLKEYLALREQYESLKTRMRSYEPKWCE